MKSKASDKHVYFIGMTDATIANVDTFWGSITIERFMDSKNNICYSDLFSDSVPNYDSYKETKRIRRFFYRAVKMVLKRDPNAVFLRYNEFSLHEFNKWNLNLLSVNKYFIFRMFDNKFKCRKIFNSVVSMLDYKYFRGMKMRKYIERYFEVESASLVIQEKYGFSGSNTIVLTKENYKKHISQLKWYKLYSLTLYVDGARNVNVHVFIGDDEVICYEPSRQIVENINDHMVYVDGVFDVGDKEKKVIGDVSTLIAYKMKEKGYRGVLGIDYMMKDNEVYFMEINPRFQRSSNKLNEMLINKGELTLFQRQLSLFE